MNILKLKGKIVERGMNTDSAAVAIGINSTSLYRKFKKPHTFTVVDAARLKEVLALTDQEAIDIFFG